MHPPLVNVTPRIMLNRWAENPFMPDRIDDSSCSLLFKAVIKNLQNQEFQPDAYGKIKNKCLSYLTLNSKNCPETASDDELLENDNSPLALYNRIFSLVKNIVTHKRLLSHLQESHKEWEDMSLEVPVIFSIDDTICSLHDNVKKNRIVYTETTKVQGTMQHITTLTLTRDEFERIKANKKKENLSAWKRLGEVKINFNYVDK